MMKRTLVGLAALAVATVAGVAALPSGEASYEALDRNGDPMKAAFNADSGKVRVVMLVAPT